MSRRDLAQSLQRSTQAFGFRRLGLMIQTRLFDRLGLGALREIRVAETLSKAVPLLFGGGGALRKTLAFLTDVDHSLERQREGCFVHDHLSSALSGKCRQLDRAQSCQPRD